MWGESGTGEAAKWGEAGQSGAGTGKRLEKALKSSEKVPWEIAARKREKKRESTVGKRHGKVP